MSETCEACLPFRTADDFKNYISREQLEQDLTRLISRNEAISVIGFGGSGKTTLVNRVILELGDYRRIDVLMQSPDIDLFSDPQRVVKGLLLSIIKSIDRESGYGNQSTSVAELAASEVSSHSISSVPSDQVLQAIQESKRFHFYVDKIEKLLENESKTFVVILDDLADLRDKNHRRALINAIRALCKSVRNNKMKFLVVARETETLGRESLLERSEILELEDHFACLRVGGFELPQVERFMKEVMHFRTENENVVEVLFRKTQGRPRVLCYALTSFKRKYGLVEISLADALDEKKFPSMPKQQLVNYLNEMYGEYQTELIAASVLRDFTKDELHYLCSKIGKEFSDAEFMLFRSAGLLDEHRDGIFVPRNTHRSLLHDIYESLLNEDERFRYSKLMVDYHKDGESLRDNTCTVFFVNQTLRHASSDARQELLRTKMNSAKRLSQSAYWSNFYVVSIVYGEQGYDAAVELGEQKEALHFAETVLDSALNARSERITVDYFFGKMKEAYDTMSEKDDESRTRLIHGVYCYARYCCDVLNQYDEARKALEEARTVAEGVKVAWMKFKCSFEICDIDLGISIPTYDVISAKKALDLLRSVVDEELSKAIHDENTRKEYRALIEHRAASICRLDGDINEAVIHERKALEYYAELKSKFHAVSADHLARLLLLNGESEKAADLLEQTYEEVQSMSPFHGFSNRLTLIAAYLLQDKLRESANLAMELQNNKITQKYVGSAFQIRRAVWIMKQLKRCDKNSKASKHLLKMLIRQIGVLENYKISPKSESYGALSATLLVSNYITQKKNESDLTAQLEVLQTQDKVKQKILRKLVDSISKSDLETALNDLVILSLR